MKFEPYTHFLGNYGSCDVSILIRDPDADVIYGASDFAPNQVEKLIKINKE